MGGTITIQVKGVTLARRHYNGVNNKFLTVLEAMLSRIDSRHAIITVAPDVTEYEEREHCASIRARQSLSSSQY